MRMRVCLRHAAVRGPARVRDAELTGERRVRKLLLELRNLADRAPQAELVVRLQHREARRVVTAILEPLQPFDEHRHYVALTDGTHDSAHILVTSCPARER